MARFLLNFTVNGEPRELLVDPRRSLLDVLRSDLDLRGAHRGCDSGDCGACTVLLTPPDSHQSMPVAACLVLAAACHEATVLTVEGLAQGGELHPLQRALVQHGAIQCGFCTPGVVMAGVALLADRPHPSEAEVRRALAGNLCRCTGYKKIVEAVLAAGDGAA